MRKFSKIIIHCSATPASRKVSVSDIRKWHKQRGFYDIGYHFIIHQDGVIESGRPLSSTGAHCKGHNRDSIGICYIGGLDEDGNPCDTRTPLQLFSLRGLVSYLLIKYPDIISIHGHNEFANKSCPCFDVKDEFSYLLKGGVLK